MFARKSWIRNIVTRICALTLLVFVAACDGLPTVPGGASAPSVDPSRPTKVALLIPNGSTSPGDRLVAQNLEAAARMAVADLTAVPIDLAVYNTGGDPATAAAAARQAVADGAKVILGPLHREAAVAASTAVARDGVSVLSFSNTSSIAGGNLFLLGQLYETTATRLVGYAARNGVTRLYIASADGPSGALGRSAIRAAAAASGAQIVGEKVYPLSQADIMSATTTIAAEARAAGAQAVITTAQPGAELAILGTLLPESGLNGQIIGLTRWDAAPEMLELPGLEGGLFAMPDTARQQTFAARYAAAHGSEPHPLAGLAYDGVAAIGALVATGRPDALSAASLTRSSGFQGTSGIFRLRRDGRNDRGLSVATVSGGQVRVLEGAPASFGRATN